MWERLRATPSLNMFNSQHGITYIGGFAIYMFRGLMIVEGNISERLHIPPYIKK